MDKNFNELKINIFKEYNNLIKKENIIDNSWNNNIYTKYLNPIITRNHIPPFWKYDFNEDTNPYCMERLGVNATLNSGAIELNSQFYLVVRVEGNDRKSFFAVAQSDNGIDNFKFWDYPVTIPETENPDVNVYDMRLTKHQDGWIYGVFCTERKDIKTPKNDTSSATAKAGIARTKDLITWERLADLKTKSPQQRNVILHPEFINGKYAFYTRPQDGFISTGEGGGISWGLSSSIENAEIENEILMDSKIYHTVKEVKNGGGAPPIKTDKGWLHIAHGVRNTAAGLRYVLYAFMCDLDNPSKVIYTPSGHFLAPQKEERVGDVSNVVFCNGLIVKNNTVYIYYASSDTRMHVATTTIDKLIDYVIKTPKDPLFSGKCVQQRSNLIKENLKILNL